MITPFYVSEMPYWLYIGYYTTYFVCIYVCSSNLYYYLKSDDEKWSYLLLNQLNLKTHGHISDNAVAVCL